jgi:hypothetical protein
MKKPTKKQPFQQETNLDDVTVTCPCGASISGEGEPISNFMRLHKAHTNGKCRDYITDDGMRCISADTARTSTYKVK